jgi:hypothetical protein
VEFSYQPAASSTTYYFLLFFRNHIGSPF